MNTKLVYQEVYLNKPLSIHKLDNGRYVLKYNNKFTYKEERPIYWGISTQICNEYTTLEYAKADLRSFKKYFNKR